MSKAIVVRKSPVRTLAAPVRERVVPGREIVPSESRLANAQTKTIELSTREGRNKGGLPVVNGRDGTAPAPGQTKQTGSGQIWAANNGVTLRGLVKAVDAIRVATQFGIDAGAFEAALGARVLSMGNKRKKQALAGGGYIQRRVGGTGYGGAHNRGFLKGRGGKGRGGPSYGGHSENPYDYVSKKRSNVGDAPTPTVSTAGGKQLALEDTKGGKQLALEDAKGKKQLALTNGEGNNQLAKVPKKPLTARPVVTSAPGAAGDAVRQIPVVGQVSDLVKTAAADLIHDLNPATFRDTQREYGYKLSDVLDLAKAGKIRAAIDTAMARGTRWRSEKEKRNAMEKLEEFLRE